MKHNYKKLKIWIDSFELCLLIYKVTAQFPKNEMYGLVSQINRSSISIPSNIAEGSSRSSERDFSRFLEIALGSLFELNTQINIAYNLKFIEEKQYLKIDIKMEEIKKMIIVFKNSLKND